MVGRNAIERLQEQCDALQKQCNSLGSEVSVLKKQCNWYETTTSVDRKISQLSDKIGKDNKKETDASTSAIQDVERKNKFNTCVFLCIVSIFNILAIWFIIYGPVYFASTQVAELTWFCILPLIAITLINLTSLFILGYYIEVHKAGRCVCEIVIETFLFMLNTVAMWIFAFHPMENTTGAVIALAVFLTLGNVLSLIIRKQCVVNDASLAGSIIGPFLLVAILIIFIGWIRI